MPCLRNPSQCELECATTRSNPCPCDNRAELSHTHTHAHTHTLTLTHSELAAAAAFPHDGGIHGIHAREYERCSTHGGG